MPCAAPSRRWVVAGVVGLALCAAIGILAGVLTHNRRQQQQSALASGTPPPPLASQPSAGPGNALSSSASASPGAADAEEDAKAQFYAENQRPEESLYMVLAPDSLLVGAQSGRVVPLAYAGWGPCRALRAAANISLDLSASATGCRGPQCAISVRVTLPTPGTCAGYQAPYTTVYLVSGFSCLPGYYKSFVDRLATWGYAVIQYDRPLANLFTPSSETESAYLSSIMTWRNTANNTRGSAFAGLFSAGPIGVVGHSMGGGLAAILSGLMPSFVGAPVLLDPVDYTQLSLRVARQFLAEYRQPALIVTVGVHCLDRNGCVPPQDHKPSAAEEAAWVKQGLCRPDWWCCNWDDNRPGLEVKSAAELTLATDGPSGFVEAAAPGSWVARFGQAGHISFLEPGSMPLAGASLQCPAAVDNSVILPDAVALATAFLAARLRGEPGAEDFTMAWAANKPQAQLSLEIKGPAAGGVAVA